MHGFSSVSSVVVFIGSSVGQEPSSFGLTTKRQESLGQKSTAGQENPAFAVAAKQITAKMIAKFMVLWKIYELGAISTFGAWDTYLVVSEGELIQDGNLAWLLYSFC